MIITTRQLRGGKIQLFADGEPAAALDSAFWYAQGLLDGDEITPDALAALIHEAGLRRAYQAAITALSHRSYSRKELLDRLLLKQHGREACEYAVARAQELGLLDDADYAARLAQTLLERKGFSLDRIRAELSQKGIDREIIENTLENLDNDPVIRIIELLNTRFAAYNGDEPGKKKVFSALLRLGYSVNDIKTAFRECETWQN
ncbi:MAG: recombination regulator RecX [Oscillospiraceae bacterium]|jgi:regulatory protein|nr:recombination regulator RecX [Oscillospiraceae bacterium]